MRNNTLIVLAAIIGMLVTTVQTMAQFPTTPVYVNEIHYDNAGADLNEAIEVAGPAGTNLSSYLLYLYNGQGGLTYAPGNPFYLNGVIPDQGNGYGTLCFSVPGIQNGSPDGLALVYYPAGALYPEVVQFISYEGEFPANNGPALGDTSQDIGVWENTTSQAGFSLQLGGIGFTYEDFLLTGGWQMPDTATCGLPNNNQTFQKLDYCTDFLDFWMNEQSGPAIIDTLTQTVHIEVVTGTDLSNLLAFFDLCFFATVSDSITGDPVFSGDYPRDFSQPVVWYIDNKEPGKYWTIIVTEQIPEIVINELDIAQPGNDVSEYIELKNNGSSAVNLEGMVLSLIDGGTGTPYAQFTFPAGSIAGGDYYVVCANPATTMNCDWDVSPDLNLLQDGTDALILYTATGGLVDALSYGGDVPGFSEGGGTPLVDPETEFKVGLSRYPDGSDTDDNAADFQLLCNTPGYANAFDTIPCICTITGVSFDSTSACDSMSSTFGAYLTITYAKAPAAGNLVVNGQSFPVSGSPQTTYLQGIPATGNSVAINVYFSENPGCAWTDAAFFTAPPPCGKCYVVDAWTGNQSSCTPATNFYGQEIYLDVMFNPGGNWIIQAGKANDTAAFIPQSGNTGLLQFDGLISDGMPEQGLIYNTMIPGCVFEIAGLWTAPQNCYLSPAIVINEVDYVQPGGNNASFIELKNNEAFDVFLEDYFVELINGASLQAYDRIALPPVFLPAGGYFVMCADPGATALCDLDLSSHQNLGGLPFSIDTDGPDAIALYDLFGTKVDAMSYEGDVPGFTETSGLGLEDNASLETHGLSRYADGTDTDNNAADFKSRCITPGEANTYLYGYCGPFHTMNLTVVYRNAEETPMGDVVLDVTEAKATGGTFTSAPDGIVVLDSLGNLTYNVNVDASAYPWGWGGVNSLDALMVARHFTGLETLEGDYKTVGNVVPPEILNSTDAFNIALRFAGLINSFSFGDWYPSTYSFSLNESNETVFNDTLYLLCYGDVNGSHIPQAPLKAAGIDIASSGNILAMNDKVIPLAFQKDVSLGAVSLKMAIPASLDIRGVQMGNGQEALYFIENNTLTVSWFDVNPLPVKAGEAFLLIEVSEMSPCNIDDFAVLPGSEIASSDALKLSGLQILIPELQAGLQDFLLWPNPARDQIQLRFRSEIAGELSIDILNVLGAKTGSAFEGKILPGETNIQLPLENLAEGSYLVRISFGGEQQLKKLVIVR